MKKPSTIPFARGAALALVLALGLGDLPAQVAWAFHDDVHVCTCPLDGSHECRCPKCLGLPTKRGEDEHRTVLDGDPCGGDDPLGPRLTRLAPVPPVVHAEPAPITPEPPVLLEPLALATRPLPPPVPPPPIG